MRPTVQPLKKVFGSWPLGVPAFRLLMIGQITSSIGDYFAAVALPWYVLSGGGGPALLGWMLSAYGAARLVGIAVGGVLADRLGPAVTMLAMDLVRLAAAAALGVAAATTSPTFALLAPIAIVIGLAGGIFLPASLTILPSILDDKDLGGGNAMSTIVIQFGGLIGPAIGGAVVAAVGTAPAFFVDAGSFLVSASALALIARATRRRSAESADETDQSAAPDAVSGTARFIDVLRYGQILRVVLIVGLIGNLVFAGTAEVALPTLAHEEFGARGYGTLLTGVALGLIVGAVLAQRVRAREHPAYLVVGLGALMGLALAAVPFAGGWQGALICLFVFSVGNGWSGTVLITMLQIWTPRTLLGRVMSVLTLAINCTFPLSVVLAGLGVGRLGVTPFFVTAGCAIILGVAVALTQSGFRNYRDGDHFEVPGMAGGVDPQPGTTSSPDDALSTR